MDNYNNKGKYKYYCRLCSSYNDTHATVACRKNSQKIELNQTQLKRPNNIYYKKYFYDKENIQKAHTQIARRRGNWKIIKRLYRDAWSGNPGAYHSFCKKHNINPLNWLIKPPYNPQNIYKKPSGKKQFGVQNDKSYKPRDKPINIKLTNPPNGANKQRGVNNTVWKKYYNKYDDTLYIQTPEYFLINVNETDAQGRHPTIPHPEIKPTVAKPTIYPMQHEIPELKKYLNKFSSMISNSTTQKKSTQKIFIDHDDCITYEPHTHIDNHKHDLMELDAALQYITPPPPIQHKQQHSKQVRFAEDELYKTELNTFDELNTLDCNNELNKLKLKYYLTHDPYKSSVQYPAAPSRNTNTYSQDCFQLIDETHTVDEEIYINSTTPSLNRVNMNLPNHLGIIKSKYLRETVALYDTGASLNAINAEFAYKHFPKHAIQKRASKLPTDTAGGRLELREYVIDTILHKNFVIQTKFFLIPNLKYDIILGRNTLRHLGYKLIQVDDKGAIVDLSIEHPADLSHLQLPEDDVFYNRINYDIAIEKIKRSTDGQSKTTIGNCSDWMFERVKTLLQSYKERIAKHESDVGKIPKIKLQLHMKPDTHPFAIPRPYNLHPQLYAEAERQIKILEQSGWIRKSESPWAAGVTFAAKKNGEQRMCIDYRQLNLRIKDQRWTIPTINELLEKFKNKKYFSSIDLKSGYWNIEVEEKDREKLAFLTPWGLYEWNRMPFGIKTAPMFFQKAMQEVFHDMPYVLIYLDDIVILSDSEEEHIKHLEYVLNRLRQYNLKIRLDKCNFAVTELTYLGHIVNGQTCRPTPQYTGKIINCKKPQSKKEVEAFLGLCNWICRFIPSISELTKPLYALTHKKVPFIWEQIHEDAFQQIKKVIRNIKQLHLPDLNKPFFVETDASHHSIGAVLMQQDDDGILQPIEWLSKAFDQSQINWSIGEKECFASIYAIEKWERYLKPNKFVLYTDHSNLALLFNFAKIFKGNKLWRWALRLQEYSFTVTARPGSTQIVSDYLSRYNSHFESDKPRTYTTIYYKNTPFNVINNKQDNTELLHIQKQLQYMDMYNIPNSINTLDHPYSMSTYLAHHNDLINNIETGIINNITQSINIPQNKIDTNIQNGMVSAIYATDIMEINIITRSQRTKILQTNPSFPYCNNCHAKYALSEFGNTYCSQTCFEQQKTKEKGNGIVSVPNPTITTETELDSSVTPIKIKLQNNNQMDVDVDNQPIQCKLQLPDLNKTFDNNNDINDNKSEEDIDIQPKHKLESISPLVPTISDLISLQNDDPICYNIKQWILTQKRQYINELPKTIAKTVRICKKYHIDNDVLYYDSRIYCPARMRHELIRYIHELYYHVRYEKMVQIMEKRYYWPYMKTDIAKSLGVCDICYQCSGTLKRTRAPLTVFASNKIFDVLHIDLIGPFKRSKNGYKYAITMCDRFSRYLEIAPLKDMQALTCAKAIHKKWFTTFGIPNHIVSDQGTQFESWIFAQLCDICGIKRKRTTAYRPLSNGRIERMHREIKKHLRVIAASYNLNFSYLTKNSKNVDNWDEYLDTIKYKLNCTPSKITGYAPIELILGYVPTMPEDYQLRVQNAAQSAKIKTHKQFIDWYQNIKNIILSDAQNNQQKYDTNRKKKYDRNLIDAPLYKIGDLVRYYIYDANKLSPQWSEPHKITQFFDEYVVQIQSIKTGKFRTVNVDHLKLSSHIHLPNLEPIPKDSSSNPKPSKKVEPSLESQHKQKTTTSKPIEVCLIQNTPSTSPELLGRNFVYIPKIP